MKKILVSIILFVTSYSHANLYLNQQDLALQACLNRNYESLGAYKELDLKDYSGIQMDFKNINQNNKLLNFVAKNTDNFYQENISVKAEGQEPPFNAIFLRCMQFYKSKKLKHFIQHNK